MSIFSKAWNAFKKLFTSAEKEFAKLPADVQEQAKTGSGIMAILNETAGKGPAAFRKLIAERHPTVPLPLIEAGVAAIARQFKLPVTTLDETARVVQTYMKKQEGKKWASDSEKGAGIFANILAPGTPLQKFLNTIGYVYNTYVKK